MRQAVVHAAGLALSCLVSYCLITSVLSRVRSVPHESNMLGGMWGVVATVFVYHDSYRRSLHAALLRDWFGARTELADYGIRPLVLFITDPFVNVTGGRRQGFSEYDLLGVDLLVETDKLLGWPSGEFHVGFANNSGTSLSRNYVGNNFPIQLADMASANLRLTYLSCTQPPGLLMQPTLQYILNPGGNKSIPNALAVGINVVLKF